MGQINPVFVKKLAQEKLHFQEILMGVEIPISPKR
jgi:hypothetical protein